jgi:uncharacterized protein involved in outer membrane biogenesis
MKKAAIAIVVVLGLVSAGVFAWARSVFAQDAVRLASQIASAIGQPVAIDTISASIYPRVNVMLGGVSIGQPARIHVQTLRLGTDVRALLSRQIVGGTVDLDGARVELPLPSFGTAAPAAGVSAPPVEIVSIDRIALNGVEILSGGRTLRGDIVAVPRDGGLRLQSMSLVADDTRLTGSGELTSLAGPVGQIAIQAEALNFSALLNFLSAFSSGSGLAGARGEGGAATAADLTVALTADRATMGAMALDAINGRARVTREAVSFDALECGLFGGRLKGTMTIVPAAIPSFRLRAEVSDIDVAALTAFAGSPGTISGQLSGQLDIAGQSADAAGALTSARGTARVDIRNGVVKRLGLVKTIVIATSMRADAKAPPIEASADEPFSALGATLTLAGGTARTRDLQFRSADVDLRSAGSLRVDGSAIDLTGNVQLSEDLSRQAGRDLIRYTQDQGRVTLPVTVGGSAQAPSVQVNVGRLAERALKNRAQEEINKALGGLFKRK